MRKLFCTIVFIAVSISPALAQSTWTVAPGRSAINFRVKHMVLMDVEGRFRKFKGTITTPREDLTQASINASVDVSSIYTGIQDRDRELVGEKFFQADKFPEIKFESQKITKVAEEGTYKITGFLTIRNTSRPIELLAKNKGIKRLANGYDCMNLVAEGTLNRSDFGLDWDRILDSKKIIIGDTINISVKIAAVKPVEPVKITKSEEPVYADLWVYRSLSY